MRQYSKSVITFKELEKKINDYHEFGNEWGLYIDIEKNANDMEIFTKRTIRINEYGTPEYVFHVEQIKKIKKEFNKREIMPPITEIKEYNNHVKDIIKNDNYKEDIDLPLTKWSLYNLFIVTTSLSAAFYSSFLICSNLSKWFNDYYT